MKINEARQKILAIFSDASHFQEDESDLPEDFMVNFIDKTISSCNEECLFNEEDKAGLSSCLDSLREALETYHNTTRNITSLTDGTLPEIGTLIDTYDDEKLKAASSKLKSLQQHLKEEINTADEAIKVFQSRVEVMKNISAYDPVTKLRNAYTFVDDMLPPIRIGARRSLDMGILMFQVENYHEIINQHSPTVFNKVLVYIAKVLQSYVRTEHKIYRYNHGTFLIILNRSSLDDIAHSEQRIITQITKNHIEYNKKPVPLTICTAKTNHQAGDTIDTIIKRLEEQKTPLQ